MSAAYIQVHFKLDVFIKASNMNPSQTSEQSNLGPHCLQYTLAVLCLGQDFCGTQVSLYLNFRESLTNSGGHTKSFKFLPIKLNSYPEICSFLSPNLSNFYLLKLNSYPEICSFLCPCHDNGRGIKCYPCPSVLYVCPNHVHSLNRIFFIRIL